MKYTIIDGKKKTPFVQQNYDSVEDANTRLRELNDKFRHRLTLDETNPSCLRLSVVGVDDDGEFHEVASATASKTAAPSKPSPQGPQSKN
jgi:hypothetical protein